jgi:NAD(P)-dependent dehydrogenase (short-subunit alcohol dehydrogenase family)
MSELSSPWNLQGRAILVTGGTQGLGLEIARVLLRCGADVAICGRSNAALETARADLAEEFDDSRVIGELIDVTDQGEVDRFARSVVQQFGSIFGLVNNAGIYGPMGSSDSVDREAWIEAIQVNLVGSFSAMRAVMPYLKHARAGRIVQLSGGGATSPMPMISAYAASKAAVVRLAESIAGELEPFGVQVNSVAPGALNTRLLGEVLAAGPEQVGESFYSKALAQDDAGGTPLSVPASLVAFLMSDESRGLTGKLISAVWDDWRGFPGHLDVLMASDVFTIRRITLEERGLTLS